MLPRRRLAPVDGPRRHIVDELVVLDIEPVLLTLHKERDLGPFKRSISVAERAGPMLPGLRRLDAFGVTNGAGVLDLGAYPLLVGVAQTAVRFFDAIGEGMNVDASILADGPPGSLCCCSSDAA